MAIGDIDNWMGILIYTMKNDLPLRIYSTLFSSWLDWAWQISITTW